MSGIQRDPQDGDRRTRRGERLLVVLVILAAAVFVAVFVMRHVSTHDDFRAVAFPDHSHGWAIADVYDSSGRTITGGAIYATTNGGTTWQRQESATTWCSPSEVAFANARCGWVLGSAQPVNGALAPNPNILLATADSGATWKRQDPDTDVNLSDVACTSATHAWAVGGSGVIVATTDGGATWQRQASTTTGGLNSVTFADARHGWAVGHGVILATTDGGRTWKAQDSVGSYTLTCAICAGPEHAWALGGDYDDNRDVILATSDGGTTWTVQYSSTSVNLTGLAFVDATHGWAVGLDGVVLATTDGGDTWKPQRSGTTMDLLDVAFANTTHGLVVGDRTKGNNPMAAQFTGSIVLHTTDGGLNWVR